MRQSETPDTVCGKQLDTDPLRYGGRVTYERIKHQTGWGKKAIVAVARRLALRVRRVLLDHHQYHDGDGTMPQYAKDKTRVINRFVVHQTRTAQVKG